MKHRILSLVGVLQAVVVPVVLWIEAKPDLTDWPQLLEMPNALRILVLVLSALWAYGSKNWKDASNMDNGHTLHVERGRMGGRKRRR